MKTSEIIEDAFKYPVSNFKRLVCFGLILVVYVLSIRFGFWAFKYSPLYIVPAALVGLTALIFTFGYYLRAMKFSLKGENEIPELNDWKEMFKDGIRMVGAGFLYFLIQEFLSLQWLQWHWYPGFKTHSPCGLLC